MDLAAELTLQSARLVQERANPPRSAARWMLMPAGVTLSWSQARDALAALPKPVFVAPMNEPGWLGIWDPRTFDGSARARFDAQIANQVGYYQDKLNAFGLVDTDAVRFEPATPALTPCGGDILQWARDYAIGTGVSLAPVPDESACRVIVMPPGGGAPPLGTHPDPYGAPRPSWAEFSWHCGRELHGAQDADPDLRLATGMPTIIDALCTSMPYPMIEKAA